MRRVKERRHFRDRVRALLFLLPAALCLALAAQQGDPQLEELLDLGLKELGDIRVVSVSKKPEALATAPATVRVITREQIRERGYFTLEQVLADLPGMQFRNPQSLNSYLFMRGIPNQNNLVLVLIDGLEINELNSGGFYGGGQYNLANVSRIEVLYGPASALYGTNAVSGVINIITRDPETESSGMRIGGGYGGFASGLADISYSYWEPDKHFGVRVAAMYKTSGHADLAGRENDYNWTTELELYERDCALDLKVRLRDFTLSLNYQNRVSSAATLYTSAGSDYLDHGTRWNLRFVNLFLLHRAAIFRNTTLQSRIYFREATVLDDSVREITSRGQSGFFRPNYRAGLELVATTGLNDSLNLVSGLQLENEWLAEGYSTTSSVSPDLKPPRPEPPAMISNFLCSGYFQGEYRPLKSLQLTAGLRFDYSSVYDFVAAPRAGLVYSWHDLTIKLLYGQAFRAPKPWDFYDGAGNPGLLPERMRSLELALRYPVGDYLSLEAAFYVNRLHEMLARETFTAENGQESWRWANIGLVDTTGMELGAEMRFGGGLRAFANYSYTRSRDENDDPIPEIAEHGANLGAGYVISSRARFSLWANLLGSRRNPGTILATGSDRIDAAVVLNGSFSFINLGGFDLQFVARNILDTVYYHTSNRDPDRYRQPQRTVMVMAVYRF